MLELEKILEGLRRCSKHELEVCEGCPYEAATGGCSEFLAADALQTIEQLLEDKTTTFVDMGEDFSPLGEIVRKWECAKCKRYIYTVLDATPKLAFCMNCGRRVLCHE